MWTKTDDDTGAVREARSSARETSRRAGSGLYLGLDGSDRAVFAPPEHGVLVLGPPRSGKTAALVVPNLLCATGSVLAVSTKRDVLDATLAARREIGDCRVFDPSGELAIPRGARRCGWSPISEHPSWDEAVLVAEAMTGATRQSSSASHWLERAGALLSALLHGASLERLTIDQVVSAVNRRDPEVFLAALARAEANLALDLLLGIVATDPREQSGIWSTASGALAAYRTTAALASGAGSRFKAGRFLEGRETLYVVCSSEQQGHAAPLVAGIVREVRSAVYASARRPGAKRTAPVLLVLDELANIAPLHDLASLVAEGASQGVVTLACLQDLSQARARFGPIADGFLSLFGAKVVLGGIGDTRTLEALSVLGGDRDVAVTSRGRARARYGIVPRRSTTVSTRRERRLAPDAIARPPADEALAVLGARPHRLRLTPYYRSSPWREAAGLTGPS